MSTPPAKPSTLVNYLARSLAPTIARMIEINRAELERLAELAELEIDDANPNQE